MKRKISLLIMVLVCLALVAGILAACNPTGKKVTFYDNFENGSVYHVSIAEGDAERTMPEDPKKAGYTFAGWYFYNGENSFGRDSYKKFDIGDYDGKEDLSVFARWISAKPEEQQFVVSFYTADGVFLESDIVARGSALEIPNSLYEQEITGSGSKTFVGWKELSTGKAWFFGAGEAVLTDVDLQPILVESLNATLTVEENISVGAAVAAYDFGNAVKTSEEWLRFEIRDAATDAIIADNASDEAVPLAYGVNKFEVQGFYETIDGDKQYVGDEWNITVTRTRGEYIAVFNYLEADDGGIEEGTIDKDGFIAKPDMDLTKKGYNFIGWQLRNGKTAKFWNFATDKVSADIFVEEKNYGEVILYACYEPVPYYVATFTVGKGETLKGNSVVSVMIDSVMKLPTAEKEHYDFIGWETSSFELKDGENIFIYDDVYDDDYAHAVTCDTWGKICGESISDVTFTPIFEPHKYKITYELNGGTNSAENPEISYTVKDGNIVLQDPVKTGYEFTGWYNGQTPVEAIEAGSTGDIELTAEWKIINYNITYKLNGGTDNDDNPSEYDIEEETIVLKDPVRRGYTFLGWYNEDQTLVEVIEAGSTGDIELTAKWKVINYKITYIANGGNGRLPDDEYNIESSDIVLPDLTKDNYDFIGWYDAAGNEVDEIASGSVGDIVLYAKWELTEYIVEYVFIDENGETVTGAVNPNPNGYTVTDGIKVLSAAEKTGYEFIGWYSDEDCTESAEYIDFSKAVGDRITLYGKFAIEQGTLN